MPELLSVRHIYIPFKPRDKRSGLSERLIKHRMEKQGWIVWRGGTIGIMRGDKIYPNVLRKYTLLHQLLEKHKPGMHRILEYINDVHHGIPDFICYRYGVFKFVECKLGHEQLSHGQKECIRKLKTFGFLVEVHKLADPCTKTREADINLDTGEKDIIKKQTRLKLHWR